MSRPFTFLKTSTAITAFALSGTTAFADLTAEDVWQNMNAPITAMGGTTSGDLNRTGDITTVTGLRYDFNLPMGVGTFAVEMPDFAMIENGDGSVSIENAADGMMRFSGEINGEGSFSSQVRMVVEDWQTTATGDPGEVTYVTQNGPMEINLINVLVDGQAVDGIDIFVSTDTDNTTATTTITEGDLVTMSTEIVAEASETQMRFSDGFGSETNSLSNTGASTIDLQMALPAQGSDLMNLAPAFAQGLALVMNYTSDGSQNQQTVTGNGQNTIQNVSQGAGTGALSLTADGLEIDASVADIAVEMTDPMIPFPINFDATTFGIGYALPLSARPDPQPFGLNFEMGNLRLSPAIWEMFDPNKELDRSPMNINLDLAGEGVLNTDLTNFLAVGQVIDNGQTPFDPTSIELRDLSASALGGSANATAAFTLDSSDMITYFGFPKPVGGASYSLSGVNNVLQQLSSLGLIGSEEMFGFNMMLGMVTQPSGDDQLSGTVQLGEDGSITANGQRLR